MPGAMAASLGGTREDRSGGEQEPRPGDPEFKLLKIRAKCKNNKKIIQKNDKKVGLSFYSGNLVAGSPPCKFSAGWERLRLTGGVALWRRRAMLALGRLRFGLQRRLRGRASTGPAHRKAERAQARVG